MQKQVRSLLVIGILLVLAFSNLIYVFAEGTVLADTGFRPQTNGFSFANYGNETKPTNLTPASMQKIFGDAVCKATTANGCVLSATAQVWMDKINADMNGGHCEGMAALSSLISSGKVNLKDLDPNANSIQDLKADNPRVQEEIARWFATQYVPPTATSEIRDKTPSQLVDTMIDQLKAGTGPFTMGIYQANGGGGHAITPYSVVDMGNGIVRVMVYDNNYPGEERFIEVDRNTNQWKYTGTTNPNEPVSEYNGDASTFNLTLTPVGARVTQPQECSFCKPDASGNTDSTTPTDAAPTDATPTDAASIDATPTDAEPTDAAPTDAAPATDASTESGGCTTSVTTGANTDLVVTDGEGHKAGIVKGHAFSNIKGAIVLRPRSQGGLADDTPGAVVILPSGGKMSATVSGQGSNDVLVTSCGAYQRVEGMSQEDGKPDTLVFPSDASSVTVDTNANEPLQISGGYNNPNGADFTYDLSNVSSETGGPIQVGADSETGQFNVASSGGVTFDANFGSIDENGDIVENPVAGVTVDAEAGLSADSSDAVSNPTPNFEAAEAPDWTDFNAANEAGESTLTDDTGTSNPSDTQDANATDTSGTEVDQTDANSTEISPTEATDANGTEVSPTEENSSEVSPTEAAAPDTSTEANPTESSGDTTTSGG